MERVFVTGGTGLLGSHVCERLVADGVPVRALHRTSARTWFLDSLGVELVAGDVTDPVERLEEAMRGCSHVVHGAALVYSGGSWARVRAVNVDGTRNVLTAAARAGAVHAVHVSSVVVYGFVTGEVDELAPIDTPVPESDFYARSKREAERVAREVEEAEGLAVTILRPAALYGERDRLMALQMKAMLTKPVTFLLGRGDNTLPAVYAGNAADAVVRALRAERGGATWDVGMDHPVRQRDYMEGLARGMGRRARLVALPEGLVRRGADLLGKLGIPTPGAAHLPIERAARLAMGDNPYPSSTIRRELGWEPPVPIDAALRRTGRWLADPSHDPVPGPT